MNANGYNREVLRHGYFGIKMGMNEDGYVCVPEMDCIMLELER